MANIKQDMHKKVQLSPNSKIRQVLPLVILAILIFIFFANSVYAVCVKPDFSIYSNCAKGCELKGQFSALECEQNCWGAYVKLENEYSACLEAERKQAEQKKLEEQKLLEQKKLEEQKQLEEQKKEEEREKASTANITNVKGKLKIWRSDDTEEELTSDTVIHYGDLIETSDVAGHAMITFSDGSTIELGSNSQFEFSAPITEEYLKSITLWLGKMKAKIRSRFEIRTPAAVLADRGTDLIVEHDADTNITTIYLYEGIVDVNNTKGETFELNAGETMTVDSSGKTVKLGLSEDDWNGLTNSIETGEEFTPSHRTQAIPSGEQPSGEQKTRMASYLILIAVIVLIVFGTFFIKRKKRKEVPRETQLDEYQKRVQALIKKIQVAAFIVAAIIVVVGVFSSIDNKIKLPKTGPTIGKVPSAYSVTYNMISPMQQGTWKESVSGNSKKIELETEQVLTSIYILGENYYSCILLFGQWSCIAISEPTYKPSSDPMIYSKENPVFTGTKSIADRVANCYAVSVGTICLDKETNILLESRAKIEGGEFVLTAISLNLNPPSQEEFTLPAKPQKTPTITP